MRARAGCLDCGRRYGDEYGFPDLLIPNWAWNVILPGSEGGGLLCPCCIIRRLCDVDLSDVPFAFTSGPLRTGKIDLREAAYASGGLVPPKPPAPPVGP